MSLPCRVCCKEFFEKLAYTLKPYPGCTWPQGCVGPIGYGTPGHGAIDRSEKWADASVPLRVEIVDDDDDWFLTAPTGTYLVGDDRRNKFHKSLFFPYRLKHHLLLRRNEKLCQDWRDFGLLRQVPAITNDDVMCHYRGPLTNDQVKQLEESMEDCMVHCTFDRREKDPSSCLNSQRLAPNNILDDTLLFYHVKSQYWWPVDKRRLSWFSIVEMTNDVTHYPKERCEICHSDNCFEGSFFNRASRPSETLVLTDDTGATYESPSFKLCAKCTTFVKQEFKNWSTLWNSKSSTVLQLLFDHTTIYLLDLLQIVFEFSKIM